MSGCIKECKWICIIAYILASLGAMVYANNQVNKKKLVIPKAVSVLYGIGGIVTLVCAIKWALMKKE
jgi:hypothetical protein